MNAEIIMIGSELLLGQIVDTNSTFLAQELAGIGIDLFYKTTVGDNPRRMAEVLQAALKRSDVILTSGGLGPTEDDLTREVVAEVIGEPLEFQQELYDQIESLFKRHGFTMSPNNRKQAFIPRTAIAIENPVGTAPGFVAEKDGKPIISLAGVPRELKFLMQTFVTPYLRDRFSLGELNISSRVLKICGKGESRVDARVGDLIRDSANPTLAILAEPAQILLRITAKAETVSEARAKITQMEEEVRRRFGPLIFGTDDDTLEGVVNEILAGEQKTLALLETLTGGGIAQRFISIGSPVLTEALVANTDEARRRLAGMSPSRWSDEKCNHWALSVTLAKAMRGRAESDVAVAAIGIAPQSRELAPEEKASGKTCIAVDSANGDAYWEFRFAGTDPINQTRATVLAIEMLRRYLIGYTDPELPPRTQARP
ncbi:MAG: CinA family nicotinamide mononucleotide deamidase-related protein [Candidatus Hydrogenedentota bacterium]|nr:MAG: CinA family nicotinamide mononucleotide deamidase-related protein [Candidatus Hydrogenedentota bacterium]